jgi:hypothetical protein
MMNGFREVYSYIVSFEHALEKDLERVRDWQREARKR